MVPSNPKQKEIPYARVNHNKYMVTDKTAYIGKATHGRMHTDVCGFGALLKCFFLFFF